MLISRSRKVEFLFPDLVIDDSVVEMVSELKILGVILDSKFSFEKQARAIAAPVMRKFHPRKFHPAKIPPSENSTQRKFHPAKIRLG